ncbi:putative protein with domain of unknown function (DUF3437) [Lyophyllum shimeji]|uniref:ARM repeat-containing protein n=1 Tax=Lyophyllum shimeji TaxID=47721 RepID=A0A9P3PIK3_LYOSH|nr:putative protein with domain of unknown function (DUF3437) [Lyophyllum shimeji]
MSSFDSLPKVIALSAATNTDSSNDNDPSSRIFLGDMEDDGFSVTDTPIESVALSDYEKQLASLQTYVRSVPYETESVEEMQGKLEEIVGKIFVAAKTQNWLVLSTWDGMLQCWLLMRYPMPKSTRARLARLYYELSLIPGVEPRVTRAWADMLSRLLASKPGSKRKLEPSDLQLPWQPLWRVLQKELWPMKRIQDPSRNVVNIYLYLAEQCKRYFPPGEIPAMLETFLPLLTQDTVLTMMPILTSFLPPTHIHLYIPCLFKIWETFNSSVIDDRLIDLAGLLSEEHVSGTSGDLGEEGGAPWKDVGIWTEAEWQILVAKGLSSMNVPVGATQGSTTAGHADTLADRTSLRIKKPVNRFSAIAKILVYSMAVDGEIRGGDDQKGYVAGSKALDSLDRIITSTESFFHPSNFGPWTSTLTAFLNRLAAEFIKRLKEEQQETCKTPVTCRLTPTIRRAFVSILRTPALLAMFSKDPVCASYAQSSLRVMALLEPGMVMPELLERAYGGLEVVNETHRTTAVLNMLAGVALPLVSESTWPGGQRHLLPLLELSIPGIDLNDPSKTMCATVFIVSAIQHIKIGDLTKETTRISYTSTDEDVVMDTERDYGQGADTDVPTLSREEDRALVRESTASFADWVTSLFRRVLALFENLPEEGGRKHTPGGKQEENVLKSIKALTDVVCLHLSDELFELVLNLLYDYATTNAKSNAVLSFGQLIACLARVKPDRTMAKFLPYCISQIEEEIKHGASSVRTTSTHLVTPSDTTLHWNLAILRGCLGFGGTVLLRYKAQILDLLKLLIDKTKSERGYTATGRLVTRALHTLGETYPINSRFVNTEDWEDPNFNSDHNVHWGRLYNPEDVVIEWHVPNDDEIAFVLEILEQIVGPALDKVESLLETTSSWDSIDRNDFCRYLHACRAVWLGLATFIKEPPKEVVNPCLYEVELPEMLVSSLDVQAGFTLSDLNDSRYQKALTYRSRYGDVCQRAAFALRRGGGGEDHIDAVVGVTRAIDTFLLAYGVNRGDFDNLQKNYDQARDANRFWIKQRENSRLVFLKRAQVYHNSRVYMHALYRRRSALDDRLLGELVELSLSPYTRIRRQAQGVLHNVCGYYVRSTRYILPKLFDALGKGSDPDRMKGALYVLWNKGIAAFALGVNPEFHGRYLLSLLNCQHEEKPSIQKLVGTLAQDCLGHLTEEAVHTDAYTLATPGVEAALDDLMSEFSPNVVDRRLLKEAWDKASVRIRKRAEVYNVAVSSILEVAVRPTTHWRYVQMASRFLLGLLRRDAPTSPEVAKFFMEQTLSPQPTIRYTAQRAVVKVLAFVKIRTYSKSREEMWLDEWSNPLAQEIRITDPQKFLQMFEQPVEASGGLYVDKIRTGFVAWAPSIKAYRAVGQTPGVVWEAESWPCLSVIRDVITKADYYPSLLLLWSQESAKLGNNVELRKDNIAYIKSLAKIFIIDGTGHLLSAIDASLSESEKFKQRASAEILSGVLRGSKHWPNPPLDNLWKWTASRLNRIFAQIKPETLQFWESFFQYQLQELDPRRNQVMLDWILGLPLEFKGDSAFTMSKSLTMFGILVDSLGVLFNPKADRYVQMLFDNANTDYAEMRAHICQNLFTLIKNQWQPTYPSTGAFLTACKTTNDPLRIRDARYLERVLDIRAKLPRWREERLPPPRVSQSEYDKVGLTLLQWIWVSAHGAQACLIFPYAIPLMPEILRMSELNDSPDLQMYSSAVLYVLSAVSPPVEYVAAILNNFATAIKSSQSWRIRLHALPALVVFFYRNLLSISQDGVMQVMDVLLECLGDENVEVREMASKALSGIVRCSQRQSILPLKNRFVALTRKIALPPRRDPSYAESLRSLHSAILGLCALIESFPYSVEPWIPPLTEVLAPHATDPPPISTTIRKCASEFKKTHQDTWHKDQYMFNEDQLQSLSTMLVGTSYYA